MLFTAYIGSSGTAHRIKKAYVGVNGKAKCMYNPVYDRSIDDSIEKISTSYNLSYAAYQLTGISTAKYAIFGGGYNSSSPGTYYDIVTAFNKNRTRTIATSMSQCKNQMAGTSISNYALFGGGRATSDPGDSYIVETYSSSLVHSTATDLSEGRIGLASASNSTYAMFGGGLGSGFLKSVDAYSSSLVKSIASDLDVGRDDLGAANVGDYVLFGGGYNGSYPLSVNTYNTSLVKGIASSNLTKGGRYISAATAGNYAIFAGGDLDHGYNSTADAYNENLVKSSINGLTRYNMASTSVGSFALFAGGSNTNYVSAINSSLISSSVTNLSNAKRYLAGASVSIYALFAGGTNSTDYNDIDTYKFKEGYLSYH